MDLLKKIFDSIIEPGKQYGKLAGGAGYELYRAGRSALGDKNAYFDQSTGKTVQNPFLSEQEIKTIQQKPLETAARRSAGAASYLVPFGKGANILSKVLLPGFTTGALTKASEDNASVGDIAGAGAAGLAGSGLLHGATSVASKALGNLGSGLQQVGNKILGGQYNLSKADRLKLNLNDTIQQLANYGVKNINDVIPIAQQVTGDSGILTKLTRDAVSKAKSVDTSGIYDIAKNLASDPSIPLGQDKKLIDFIKKGVQSFTDKGNPLDTFDFIKKLEGQASSIKGVTEADKAMKRAYKSIADELKNRLFQQSGADAQLVDLTNNPQILQQLSKISPKLAEAAQKATSVGELRSVASPFVKGAQAAKKSMEGESGKLFGLTDILTGVGGANIFGPAGAGLSLIKKFAESDKGLTTVSNALNTAGKIAQTSGNLGGNLSNNPIIQQALGQLGGRSIGIFPSQIQDVSNNENNGSNNQVANSGFKQGFENNHSDSIPLSGRLVVNSGNNEINNEEQNYAYNSKNHINGIIPQQNESNVSSGVLNAQNMQERVQSDAQGNQWIETASGDVLSTDKQWKWDFQTNDWVPNAQGAQTMQQSQSPLSEQQFQQLFITDLIKNNGRNLDKLTTLQKLLSPGEDLDTQIKRAQLANLQAKTIKAGEGANKPLNAEQQKLAINAQNGLSSLETIQQVAANGVPITAELPDFLGGNQSYVAAVNNLSDVIGRMRSGGAINKDEEKRFKNLLPKVGDNQQTINYKINSINDLLQKFAYRQEPAAFENTSNQESYSVF